LLLTNQQLKNLGLKSLVGIYKRYAKRNRHILRKISKKRDKIGSLKSGDFQRKSPLIPDNYWQKAVLGQLEEITNLTRKIERKITKIEKKLENG